MNRSSSMVGLSVYSSVIYCPCCEDVGQNNAWVPNLQSDTDRLHLCRIKKDLQSSVESLYIWDYWTALIYALTWIFKCSITSLFLHIYLVFALIDRMTQLVHKHDASETTIFSTSKTETPNLSALSHFLWHWSVEIDSMLFNLAFQSLWGILLMLKLYYK